MVISVVSHCTLSSSRKYHALIFAAVRSASAGTRRRETPPLIHVRRRRRRRRCVWSSSTWPLRASSVGDDRVGGELRPPFRDALLCGAFVFPRASPLERDPLYLPSGLPSDTRRGLSLSLSLSQFRDTGDTTHMTRARSKDILYLYRGSLASPSWDICIYVRTSSSSPRNYEERTISRDDGER